MDIFELFFEHFDEAKKHVLEGKIDTQSLSEGGSNLFHYACFFGDIDLMHYCYDKVNVELCNDSNANALELSLNSLGKITISINF